MGLWNTYQQRIAAAKHVRLRLVSVEALAHPVGVLQGSVALESATPVVADLVFRLVRETTAATNCSPSVHAYVVATAHYLSARVLRPGEVTLLKFSLPYNLAPAQSLAWQLTQAPTADEQVGETFYLEVSLDLPILIAAAGDRVPLGLAAAS